METKTATLIESNLPGFIGDASLYRMDPPLKVYDDVEHRYVIVSAASDLFGDVTCVFAANRKGEITNWDDTLPGSRTGTLSHEKVLRSVGYTIV